MSDHTSWFSESWRSLLYSSSVYSCHLFLISFASVRSIPFLNPIFAWNVPLVSLIFLKRSLVFLILLFTSISLHWSLRKAFLNLSLLFFGTLNSNGCIFPLLLCFLHLFFSRLFVKPPQTTILPFCISFSPFHFASLLFSAICKASSNKQFIFFHFFFFGMVLVTTSCTVLQTYSHSFSDILSIRSNLLNQFITSNV